MTSRKGSRLMYQPGQAPPGMASLRLLDGRMRPSLRGNAGA